MSLAFSKLYGYFERLLELITIILMVSLALIVLTAVAFRLGGSSLAWYDEIAGIMLAWLTYYGGALAALKRAHIGVPGLVNAMPPSIRVPVVWLAEVITISFFALLAWFGMVVLEVLEGDTLVSLPDVPTGFTQSVIPIGAVLFIIAQILSMPKVLEQASKEKVNTQLPSEGVEI